MTMQSDSRTGYSKFATIIAPERSGGASYSESGVSNDQVFVRPSENKCLSGKNAIFSEDICAGFTWNLQRRFEQSIFKVPKKTAFCEGRNDLPGP